MLQCIRGMCAESATAGLGYDITRTTAWIYDLDAATMAGAGRQRDVVVPLCPAHADRIRVPQGWAFQDQRVQVPDPIRDPVPAPDPAPVDDGAPDTSEAAPLFEPRSRPEPEPLSEVPAQPSLLERAFRAAPVQRS